MVLLGEAGIGKSTLAHAYSRHVRDDYAYALSLDLTHVRHEEDLLFAFAVSLGVRLADTESPADELALELRRRGRAVVVLDGIDQVAPELGSLLAVFRSIANQAHFICTARRAPALPQQVRLVVTPLDATQCEVVYQSQRLAPGLLSSGVQGHDVEADLEFAEGRPDLLFLAARATALSAVNTLENASRASLQGALFDALADQVKEALVGAAVFRASFDVAALSAVLASPKSDVHRWLESLVTHGVVEVVNAVTGVPEFRIAPVFRDFAARLYATAPERRGFQDRYVAYFRDWATRHGTWNNGWCGLPASAREEGLRYRSELDAVLGMLPDTDAKARARVCLALHVATLAHAPRAAAYQRTRQAVAFARRAEDPALLLSALLLRAEVVRYSESWRLDSEMAEVRRLAETVDDASLAVCAYSVDAIVSHENRAHDTAEQSLQCALRLQTTEIHACARATLHCAQAMTPRIGPAVVEQARLFAEAASLYRKLGALPREAHTRLKLARCQYELGDFDAAVEEASRGYDALLKLRDGYAVVALGQVATYVTARGDDDIASAYHRAAAAQSRAGGRREAAGLPVLAELWDRLAQNQVSKATALAEELERNFPSMRAWQTEHASATLARGFLAMLDGATERAERHLAQVRDHAIRSPQDVIEGAIATLLFATCASLRSDNVAVRKALSSFDAAWFSAPRVRASASILSEALPAIRLMPGFGLVSDASPAYPEARAARWVVPLFTSAVPELTIRYDAKLRWLAVGRTHVDLRRRPVLRRVVSRLVRGRIDEPSIPVPALTLIESTWPGDRSKRHALDNRLWVALSTLRKLGLSDLIVREGDGYLIPEFVELVVEGEDRQSV